MLHDPKGMRLHPHAPLGPKGEGGCTLKLWLHLEMLLAATAVVLYLPSPVGLKCGVGFDHPKWQGKNARLMSSKSNSVITKNSRDSTCLMSEAHSALWLSDKRNLIYLFFYKVQKFGDGGSMLLKYLSSDISCMKAVKGHHCQLPQNIIFKSWVTPLLGDKRMNPNKTHTLERDRIPPPALVHSHGMPLCYWCCLPLVKRRRGQ
jgi:hypothetical protein